MSKKRSNRGFTIVEIAIVIVIIAVLATMTLLVYNNVQKQTRDTKRTNDATLFMSALDSYYSSTGEYPFSCTYGYTTDCSTTSSQYQSSAGVAPVSTIGSDTTSGALQALLPGVGSSFGDPTQGSANPINVTAGGPISKHSYFFLSTDLSNLSGSVALATSDSGSSYITCSFGATSNNRGGTLRAGASHYYIVGYFSEVQNKWILDQGPFANSVNDLRWNYDNKPECAPAS